MLVRVAFAWIILFSIVNQIKAQDVWLQNNFSPVTACSLSNAENVNVLINNNSGTVMASNTITVSYSVNGGTPVLQLLNSNLFPGASWNFTFSVKADLSACGTYALKVWVTRPGDVNQLNDTLQWNVTNNCFNTPGSISGAATVCQGQDSVIYTFPSMLNATTYNWTLPNGASGSSSTNSIKVNYSTIATSGNITVAGTNTCGSSTAATLPVSVNPLPDAGGNISGATTVCPGETGVTYTVPVIANALSYQWTLPGGATGASTTNQIVLDYSTNAVSGPLTVEGINACGNGVASSASITINTDAPVAICQNITQYLNAAGTATITASQVNNGSSDACGIAGLSVSPATFTCANIGANTVTLTVTDNSSNISTCNATVTILDTIRPVAICRNVTTYLDANGNATVTAAQINNGSTDACGIASLALDITTFDCSDIGANTVVLTVTDVNGNTSTCTATVTVEDTIAPVTVCQSLTVQLDATGNATITAGDINNGSTDACGIAAISVDVTDFDCSDIGANTVVLTVTDVNGNASTCTATVTVADTIAPVAICRSITVQLDANGNATIAPTDIDNGSTDACGIAARTLDITAFDCSNVGANTVTLTVTDVNGNASTCTAVVTVQDTTAPVASCRNITVQLDASGSVTLTGAQVDNGSTDLCGVAALAVSPNSFDCSNVGANTVTLTVTDASGNTSACTATVTVEDTTAPTAICQNVNVALSAAGTASITAAQINNGSADACGIATITVSPTNFTCANTGANNVTLTVTDVNGNTSTCTAVVTVTTSGTAVGNTLNKTVCSGFSYNFNGQLLTTSGTYYDTLATVNGCDSVVTLNLVISLLNTSSISASICPTAFYNFYGRILTDAGVYTDTASSLGGCDTIVTLTLTKTTPNTNATVSGNVCTAAQSGATYQWYTCNTGQPIQGATAQSYTATQPGSYQCLVTFDSCAVPTICVLVNPVDIGVLYSYKFNLYPNPNAGTFSIQHDYPGEIGIVIEDMLGQRLKQFNMASATGYFDINEFAAGIYNVIVSDKNERLAVIKVVRQ